MKPLVSSVKYLKTFGNLHKESISEQIRNLLPLYPSERLSGIIGDMFGDGHLQEWRLDFTSASLDELNRFEKEFKLQFGIKGKVRPCSTNKFGTTYNYGINNKFIARVLFLSGVPRRSKILQPTRVPEWILVNKKYFRRFVQRYFDCEASVETDGTICISMSKSKEFISNGHEFLNEISTYLMKYYSIRTTNTFELSRFLKRKDGILTKEIKIKIRNKESINRFYRNIGFQTPHKQQRLILAVKSIKNSRKGW